MLKFRPSNLTQKRANINFSELQLVALIEKGLSDNSLRGFLYKRSSPSAKWRMKWFLLFENLLFYFDISPQEQQQNQIQQQQQSQSQNHTAQVQQSPSKSSGFSSLIRRSGPSSKQTAKNQPQPQQQQQQQKQELWPETAKQLRLQLAGGAYDEPRRASAGETLSCGAGSQPRLVAADGSAVQENEASQQQQQRRPSSSEGPKSRQRLQSDPQNLHCGPKCLAGGGAGGCGNNSAHSTNSPGADSLSLGRERPASTTFAGGAAGLSHPSHHRVVGNCHSSGGSVSRGSSRTLNSSSISGVSSHFLTHNEQTIGRSTTTTAGRTPIHVASSNYSSLLNRKIGVIFLEGSYCERLVDSPVDFETTSDSAPRCSSLLVAGAANCMQSPPTQSAGAPIVARNSLNAADGNDLLQCRQNNMIFQEHIYNSDRLLAKNGDEDSELYCTFTLKWRKEGSKEYQFRTETEAECQTWVHAISNARYSTLLNDKEQLEQKYLHLSQIIESESTAKWQYSRQCEELSTEIKKLRQEICLLKRQESRSNQLRLVLSKSAAIVETILRQQRRRQQQQQRSKANASHSKQLVVSHNFAQNQQQHARAPQAPKVSPAERPSSCGAAIITGAAAAVPDGRMSSESSRVSSPLPGGDGGSGNRIQRTRSMEQEQAEQEMAVRRARRYNVANYTRLASLDERDRSVSTSPTSGTLRSGAALGVASNSTKAATGALAKSLVRAASGATSSMELQRARRKLIRLSGGDTGSKVCLRSSSNGSRQQPENKTSSIGLSKQQAIANLATTNKLLVAATNELTFAATNETAGENSLRALDNSNDNKINGTKADNSEGKPIDEEEEEGEEEEEEEEGEGGTEIDDGDNIVDGVEEEELSIELKSMVEALNNGVLLSDYLFEMDNSEEIRKIKKVQGFFRGWLCRRRWKQIVQEYIKSPHAELMRKRNNLVFRMVECEEEYVEQLNLLISAYLRPIKMAASSQKPALSHDELNSIFLNSETLLFLHQIFLKGLTARMESWPTLVLGDLFNMLLPMLTIYQEYVRNHHFSLQVLAECKQRDQFSSILHRLEEKPQLNGRTLETFLTYPMHQIPRYIICLHEILAHTPHNHVERKNLYEAQTKLEDLSQVIEVPSKHPRSTRSRFTSFAVRPSSKQQQHHTTSSGACSVADCQHNQVTRATSSSTVASSPYHQHHHYHHHQHHHHHHQQQQQQHNDTRTKELVRQCFLFTNHLLLCTRTKDGKLHLLENIGRISLAEVTLIENPAEFIQQQETIVANFELVSRPTHHHSATRSSAHSQASGTNSGGTTNKNSSCNSIADQFNSACADVAPGSQYNDKRASTSSVPSKWGSTVGLSGQAFVAGGLASPSKQAGGKHTSGKRTSFVDSVQDANNEPDHNNNNSNGGAIGSTWRGHSSSNALFSNAAPTTAASMSPTTTPTQDSLGQLQTISFQEPQQQQYQHPSHPSPSKSSSRGSRITGYLATKLSNLTSLGSSAATAMAGATAAASPGNQHNRDESSSSAPPSPLNKRPLSQMFATGTGNSANLNFGSAASSKRSSRASSGGLHSTSGACCCCSMGCDSAICLHQPPFSLTKDYGGCDFILLLESTSKITSSASNSMSNPLTGASGVPSGVGSGCGSASAGGGVGGSAGLGGSGGGGLGGHRDSLAASGVSGASGNMGCNSNATSTSLAGNPNHHQQSGLLIIHLVAPNLQEKAAWMSDISQVVTVVVVVAAAVVATVAGSSK